MLCSAGLPGFIPSHYSLECMQNTYQLLLSTSAAAINCIVLASSIRHEPCSRIIIIIKSERINCKDYLHSSSRRSHLCPLVMMLMKMDSRNAHLRVHSAAKQFTSESGARGSIILSALLNTLNLPHYYP